MKEAYKQWFYGKIHSFFLSNILGNIAYFLFVVVYTMKKIQTSNKDRLPTRIQAKKILQKTSPCPSIEDSYESIAANNESMELSVIVPVYNYEDVLKETIDSILNQETTYEYEVILVDDGSTDGSGEIVDQYEDHPKTKIIHQQNAGIAAARNTGIENSSGNYIMFVDCDDILKNNMVQVMLDTALREQSDIVECGFYYFKTEDGKLLRTREFTYPEETLYQGDKGILKYPGLPWAKVYKREMFEQLRFPNGFWFEDTIIHCIAFQQCKKFTFLNQCLYGYRVYEKNYTKVQQKSLRSIEHLWIVKYMIHYANQLNLPVDDLFYETILRHLGPILCNGTNFMDERIQKSIFVEASHYLRKLKGSRDFKLNYMLKQLEKSILNHQYEQWKLVCKYI
ncbi:MAG: glycosyltransferase family 2 protein [Anaerostipes sp.]|jgi:glycosyltransferase involved in cell wall biosynthesis